jgi:hypothetical protein
VGGIVVLSTVTALRAQFLSLTPSHGVELWRFAGAEGRRIAREPRGSGELAELWFALVAREAGGDVHHSVAVVRDGKPCDWLAVVPIQTMPLPDFPGRPSERAPSLSELGGQYGAALGTSWGQAGKAKT